MVPCEGMEACRKSHFPDDADRSYFTGSHIHVGLVTNGKLIRSRVFIFG